MITSKRRSGFLLDLYRSQARAVPWLAILLGLGAGVGAVGSAMVVPGGAVLALGAAVLIGGCSALTVHEPAWEVVDVTPTPRRARAAIRILLGATASLTGLAAGGAVAGGMPADQVEPFVSIWATASAIAITGALMAARLVPDANTGALGLGLVMTLMIVFWQLSGAEWFEAVASSPLWHSPWRAAVEAAVACMPALWWSTRRGS